MIFPNLTVRENLEMGAYRRRDRKAFGKDFDYIFSIFPRLKERSARSPAPSPAGSSRCWPSGAP